MDFLFEESKEDKLIDDYLFSNYKHATKSTFGLDQQFAKPIEDEDLFGPGAQGLETDQHDDVLDEGATDSPLNKSSSHLDLDEEHSPYHNLPSNVLCDRNVNSPGDIFEDDEIIGSSDLDSNKGPKEHAPSVLIDEIFIDDYSMSPDNRQQQCDDDFSLNNDIARSNNTKTFSKVKEPPPPTPEQLKIQRMKEKIQQSAKLISLNKPQIAKGLEDDDFVEIMVEEHKLISDSSSKFMFGKIFNGSKKANDSHKSPKCDKMSWDDYSQSLRKQISTQKRKIWDTFQQASDRFDEEEELIEAPNEDQPEKVEDENPDPFEVDQTENNSDGNNSNGYARSSEHEEMEFGEMEDEEVEPDEIEDEEIMSGEIEDEDDSHSEVGQEGSSSDDYGEDKEEDEDRSEVAKHEHFNLLEAEDDSSGEDSEDVHVRIRRRVPVINDCDTDDE